MNINEYPLTNKHLWKPISYEGYRNDEDYYIPKFGFSERFLFYNIKKFALHFIEYDRLSEGIKLEINYLD